MIAILITLGIIISYGICSFISFGFYYSYFRGEFSCLDPFKQKRQCIFLALITGVLGPLGILFSFSISDFGKHGWKIYDNEEYVKKKFEEYEKVFENFLKVYDYKVRLIFPIFAILTILDIKKDRDDFVEKLLKTLNLEFNNFEIKPSNSSFLEIQIFPKVRKKVVTKEYSVDTNFRVPRYADKDYCINDDFDGFKILDEKCDSILINQTKENKDYLDSKNYQIAIIGDKYILVRNARSLTLPGQLKSRKLIK